jgi:protein gp37
MGAETEIAWTDATFNPWHGCVRVSQGCVNCYAEAFSKRTGNAVWGVDAPRRFFGEKHWAEPLKWNAEAEKAKQRKRVFCASMADVFEWRGDLEPWRAKLWRLIEVTPWLDWQLLTKRPENIALCLPSRWEVIGAMPTNIWLGTTAENQEAYDKRWPILAEVQRRFDVRHSFISYEPALGRLELKCHGCGHDVASHFAPDRGGCSGWFPSWVIAGGESGNGARDFDINWAALLLQECTRVGVPFFFKQAGARPVNSFTTPMGTVPYRLKLANKKGADMNEIPLMLHVREFPRGR